ncbi:hypothetical protein ACWN8V_03095 [Vagococcus elongatus]|uniref:Uncharacterized protein n=1 Tax=Vagococcus elongatus TaxID=180344 RepID=A0A430B1U8_9ENTE|nr:hypothetical protein [Vagococcus elongatus]RSU14304.1 hypothetical protein CBF29_03105 [Vagococcus elongatus]
MGDRERQRKFDESSNIRKSEFDRHNTNMTRQTNPIGKGQNFLPTNPKAKKTRSGELLFQLLSGILGVACFLLISFLGKKLLPYDRYSSLFFLFITLIISSTVAYVCFKFFKKRFKL